MTCRVRRTGARSDHADFVRSACGVRLYRAAALVLLLLTTGCAGLGGGALPGDPGPVAATTAAPATGQAVARPEPVYELPQQTVETRYGTAILAPLAPPASMTPVLSPPVPTRPAAVAPLAPSVDTRQVLLPTPPLPERTVAPARVVAPAIPPPTGATVQAAANMDAQSAKVLAKVPAPAIAAAPVGQPQARESLPPAPAGQVATPPLNLKSLETRLRETKAIGVFTKLALKNQVDDLLDQFRAFYQGRLKVTLAELRRPYDLLLLKVLALLQDADAALAGAIVASREAIWGILADPVKFNTV